MTVSFMGYSERGIVIALCDDIVHSKQRIARLGDLLTAIKPGNRLSELIIDEATILVEQGFSDFGDADLVFLIDHTVNGEKKKLAIFVEAKVHTDTSHPKTLRARWREFIGRLEGDMSVKSNLFVQLYRKMRLINKLTNPDEFALTDSIASRWSLGANQVIQRAADKLREYAEDSWFIGLIPDTDQDAISVKRNEIERFDPAQYCLPEWNASQIGFLTWPAIEEICERDQDDWPQTLKTFKSNLGQIYNEYDPTGLARAPEVHDCCLYRGQTVLIRNRSSRSSRWVDVEHDGQYFSESERSKNDDLEAVHPPPKVDFTHLIPSTEVDYEWNPPPGNEFRPNECEQVPQPPRTIRVVNAGAKTTRVREVGLDGEIIEPSFRVFTHHIRRAES
jgi:hypothetical protein